MSPFGSADVRSESGSEEFLMKVAERGHADLATRWGRLLGFWGLWLLWPDPTCPRSACISWSLDWLHEVVFYFVKQTLLFWLIGGW